MNAKQREIVRKQLALMRTPEEVRACKKSLLILPDDDPRGPILDALDREYCAAEDNST